MLTRLKISGFKNLVNVDVRFGPFTCIAGVNGVGKSNLFDAIMFLSALADKPLLDAAKSVRDEEGRTSDIRSLFHRFGNEFDKEMSLEAEMIVPQSGIDDLGQDAEASITSLRYLVRIGHKIENGQKSGGLELLEEALTPISLGDASKSFLFPHKAKTWRASAVKGRRSGAPFISTEGEGKERIIKLHKDGGGGGRPRSILAANLPRTVLSTTNADESPTALMAKREMQSWRLLQLEPAALRKPDDISAPTKLGADGSHLAAALYHLSKMKQHDSELADEEAATCVYAQVANRLADLIDDVKEITVDYDEKRESLTAMVTGRDGTPHSARSLSDGTLRFLALTILELDTEASGLICLEEPENGIHPERIPAMLNLLQDIAMDTEEPVGQDNPLRQVIINTHSPVVVAQIPGDSLLMAESIEMNQSGKRYRAVRFSPMADTWRQKKDSSEIRVVSKGKVLSYLNPVTSEQQLYGNLNTTGGRICLPSLK
ncbi:MAG: ATPase [Geobacteraceae bacterium GWC2_58_44]|nr:MAG: ATPase [Geobacteraceae bacterium GWC2_58_44]HBG05182.1 ATPase [Geobacter sp.]